jgi:uncharacterized protein (TIGR02246 family)
MVKKSEEAIRWVIEQHAEIWNRHDMTAYAALFADDADLVNIRGGWWQGRAQIEERMTALHKTFFRESQIVPADITIRFLQKNIAIAHVRWKLTGILDRDGQTYDQIQNTITTWTMTRRGDPQGDGNVSGGTWQIEAFQNTEIAPPPPRLSS